MKLCGYTENLPTFLHFTIIQLFPEFESITDETL